MKKCYFRKDEFYSTEENDKINLLCSLYEKKKIEKVSGDIEITLNQIINDIDKEEIDKRKIEEFFENSEEVVKRRLRLIKIIFQNFSPENAYDKLNNILKGIKNDIEILSHIKRSLSIYQKEMYQNEIKEMTEYINKLENIKIKEYNDDKFIDPIGKLKNLGAIANQIDLVQDLLLFKVIYENIKGNNQQIRFQNAIFKLEEIQKFLKTKEKPDIDVLYRQNKKIFDIIKEKLILNERRSEEFLKTFIWYFNISGNKEFIEDFTILFKSKKYEYDLKCIIYFFNYLNKSDEWIKNLSKKYENLSEMNLKDLKTNILELKNEGIYDYQTKNYYVKLFTSLYDKKEAIDFLLSKINKDISELYDRINPNNQTITIQKIDDTKKCIEIFSKIELIKDNKKIFDYIKTLKNDEIEAFESYSKIYPSIIELDRNDNFELSIFDKINDIIKKAKFLFIIETEIFTYGEENRITMDELIHLMNKTRKINFSSRKNEEEKNDILKMKTKKLLFYKNLVNNIEIIYENMQILRTKGNNLPIDIKITIQYDIKNEANYYLDQKESNFEIIETFLLNAKKDYLNKLDLTYKEKIYTRFLYGKLFKKIVGYLDGGSHERVMDIFRYILNENNDDEIKISKPVNPQIRDYVRNYADYNSKSFENIFNYLISLFDINNTSIQKHYESMLMIEQNKYKGIFEHECQENSIGKFIYELFLQKIGQKPIAQNILITNKETSIEEIQAFLYRAILCDYNTLFVIEINESLTYYQQSIMYNFFDELLTYKMNKYKECNKGINIEKEKTNEYLEACIVFVYENRNKYLPFINEIGKINRQDIKIDKDINDNKKESEMKLEKKIDNSNIMVITSDFCGLGKTFKIKRMIEKKNQKYFYFPLGGVLTKKIISKKLLNLLENIKNENNKEIKYGVHLDLTESVDIDLINEFLLSFLITKFYTNNETIFYIPKNIEIYIEIPNCFKDYLSKFSILNIFPRENITLDNKPKLNLPNSIIEIFDRLLGLNTNEAIEKEFIEKYLNNPKKCSYYQIITFIKLFISQFNKFNSKLHFTEMNNKGEGIDITEKCIHDFARSAKYFINSGFQKLIMDKIYKEKLNLYLIDLLSNAYESDLKDIKYDNPLIFINKEKLAYNQLIIPKTTDISYKSSKDYLQRLKQVLSLPNEVETEQGDLKSLLSILSYKTDNYVITNDNFTKIVLLYYRIMADIPVILMGEAGCGKTSLIIKLNQILNDGEIGVEIINIHPGITNDYLYKKMEEVNEKAKGMKKELWILFAHMNNCLYLSILKEIFSQKTFNGKKLNDNIRLIGTCNPYRKRMHRLEICGYENKYDNDIELVYLVEPLPQSLLNYVFSFGALNEEDEKIYIYIIIEKLFNKNEEKLHEATKDVLFKCHKYLRNIFDPSVVSLRDVSKFSKLFEFFKKYFAIKRKYKELEDYKTENNEKFDKILSIIISVYLCYYIRLNDDQKRFVFNLELRGSLIALANSFEEKVEKNENNDEINDLSSKIQNEILKNYIMNNGIRFFSDFLRLEEEYLLDKIELKKGIGKNDILRENVFLMFVSVNTCIPLIIVGKPGSGKSLSAQLIYNSMRGEFSKNKFFREFPKIISTYFQGSESTKPEDIEKLFEIAENKLEFYENKEEYKNKFNLFNKELFVFVNSSILLFNSFISFFLYLFLLSLVHIYIYSSYYYCFHYYNYALIQVFVCLILLFFYNYLYHLNNSDLFLSLLLIIFFFSGLFQNFGLLRFHFYYTYFPLYFSFFLYTHFFYLILYLIY